MKALIPIRQQSINNQPLPTVSGRELHKFLEVQKQFSIWIKARIEEYGYERGRDFIAITSDNQNCASGMYNPKPAIEYHLTLDMAKELAMVERSPMGRLARKYFIRCERMVLETVPVLQAELLKERPMWRKISHYKDMGLNNVEVSRLVQVSKDTVRRHSRLMEQCGLTVKRELKKTALGAERQLPLFGEVAQ